VRFHSLLLYFRRNRAGLGLLAGAVIFLLSEDFETFGEWPRLREALQIGLCVAGLFVIFTLVRGAQKG
jgi:hypothetical protein